MWRENTGGLTYLIGHVKTTLPGQGESENALERHRTHFIQIQTKTHSEAGGTNYYQEGHIRHLPAITEKSKVERKTVMPFQMKMAGNKGSRRGHKERDGHLIAETDHENNLCDKILL